MQTVYTFAPAMAHNKPQHPEGYHRLATLLRDLENNGILSAVKRLDVAPATVADLRRVHAPVLIEKVRSVSARGGGFLDHGDTYATADSYDAARTAVGACLAATKAIMGGTARNGFAIVRPPGHHAEYDQISGFCLFNNVAAAARYAQAQHGAQRVLIFDFDVHHGNGTQDIFYHDPSVLFVSTHLFMPRMFYPGTGSFLEMGAASGEGYTLNVPLLPYVGDTGFVRILQELILPKARDFQPDLILVSAGFDAHWQDPLAMAGLSLTGIARIARGLVEMAGELCDGRILFVLEGGYKVDALHCGILNVFYALLGKDEIIDPLGPMPQTEQDVSDLLLKLKQRHLIY